MCVLVAFWCLWSNWIITAISDFVIMYTTEQLGCISDAVRWIANVCESQHAASNAPKPEEYGKKRFWSRDSQIGMRNACLFVSMAKSFAEPVRPIVLMILTRMSSSAATIGAYGAKSPQDLGSKDRVVVLVCVDPVVFAKYITSRTNTVIMVGVVVMVVVFFCSFSRPGPRFTCPRESCIDGVVGASGGGVEGGGRGSGCRVAIAFAGPRSSNFSSNYLQWYQQHRPALQVGICSSFFLWANADWAFATTSAPIFRSLILAARPYRRQNASATLAKTNAELRQWFFNGGMDGGGHAPCCSILRAYFVCLSSSQTDVVTIYCIFYSSLLPPRKNKCQCVQLARIPSPPTLNLTALNAEACNEKRIPLRYHDCGRHLCWRRPASAAYTRLCDNMPTLQCRT